MSLPPFTHADDGISEIQGILVCISEDSNRRRGLSRGEGVVWSSNLLRQCEQFKSNKLRGSLKGKLSEFYVLKEAVKLSPNVHTTKYELSISEEFKETKKNLLGKRQQGRGEDVLIKLNF